MSSMIEHSESEYQTKQIKRNKAIDRVLGTELNERHKND
jgi:hypothetical protein